MMRAPAHGMMDGAGGNLRCAGGGSLWTRETLPPQAETPKGFIFSDEGQGMVCHCGSGI